MRALTHYLALVSESEQVQPRELMLVAGALQKQAIRDFASVWDVSAAVSAFATLEDVPPGYWPMIVMDDIGFQGAAGIHLDKDNQPFALITASSTIDDWSLTASHEMCEMLADPFGNRLTAGDSPKPDQGRVEFLVEVCDPSESRMYAYSVNGVVVSDFYTPHFFDPIGATAVRYSFSGALKGPRQILPGGYLSWHDLQSDDWWQARWFNTAAPVFVNLGRISTEGQSLRATIDKITGTHQAIANAAAREAPGAIGLSLSRVRESSESKAANWRLQVAQLVESDGGRSLNQSRPRSGRAGAATARVGRTKEASTEMRKAPRFD
jgi:hypothetical protein